MRTTPSWMILLVPIALLGCGDKDDTQDTHVEGDTDTDTDTDTDADSDADTDTSPPPVELEWCSLDRPSEITVAPGQDSAEVYGLVSVPDHTDGKGASDVVTGELGYGALDSDPSADPGAWSWVAASYSSDASEYDEYAGFLNVESGGVYAYAYRFSVDDGATWLYCDLDGSAVGAAYDTDEQGVASVGRDDDGDGFLAQEDGFGDCDDGDATVNPDAVDIPLDGIDQDCDGEDALPGIDMLVEGDLVITEVHPDSAAVGDQYGEWFEIYNASGEIVDLMGLQVYDSNGELFEVDESLLVEADGLLVFGRNDDGMINGGVIVDFGYPGVALSNTADDIILDNGVEVIDRVAYDSAWPFDSGVAMALDPYSWDSVTNDDVDAWCAATSRYGDGDLGSPGEVNAACPPDDIDVDDDGYDDLTWGGTDCDDSDASIHPGASEVCDGVDNDCDGSVDVGAGDASDWYEDSDGDGYGDASGTPLVVCTPPSSGYVSDHTDCDDGDSSSYPGAHDIPDDGIDQDCDGIDATDLTDDDGDGYTSDVDCDDSDASVHPGAAEVCEDGIDQDCDGADEACPTDLDGDGYDGIADGGTDCDDSDASVHPGAAERCSDGIDQDCDGADIACVYDGDGDGYDAIADGGTDCDDSDASINPGATDVCEDGIDQDCDGADEACPTDLDGDGYDSVADGGTDCDDSDAGVHPGATEICDDGIDQDCDGADEACPTDLDGDGYDSIADGGTDCDDSDASVHPGATEVCGDGVDQDCDGVDDACVTDLDGDGYDSIADGGTDCDDSDASINPGVAEICGDGIDQNCDGADASCFDLDGDGFDGVADGGTDCNDGDSYVYPGAPEICGDGIDQDCDGSDTSCTSDSDGDGYAAIADGGTDCDDSDASVYPGATEVCGDGVDQDCDGSDTPCGTDSDGDGYDSLVSGGTDCDDTDASVHPGATEACDGVDNNCDGAVDEGVTTPYYADGDGDGYGDGASGLDACSMPSGYVADYGDCDDGDASVYPGASEVCEDGVDQDCDGMDETCSGLATIGDLLAGDLVITEIMANPAAVSDSAGEWFEVLNRTTFDVDLEGLVLSDLGTDSHTVSGSLVVASGAYVVFGNNADSGTNGGLAVDYEYPSSWYLSNGSDEIVLDNGSITIDSVVWDSSWSISSGYSLQLDPSAEDATINDDVAYWCEATTVYGSGDAGTPGTINDSCTGVGSDSDGDGFDDVAVGGTDCDDSDASVYPGAPEICGDGVDQDCDGTDTACPATSVEWCNVQWVDPSVMATGDTSTTYGQVYITGVTDSAGAGAGISAQVGYGVSGDDPSMDPSAFTWVTATYNVDDGNNDEYMADITPPDPGYYAVAYRFSDDGGSTWAYCDSGGTHHATGDSYDTSSEWFMIVGSDYDLDGYFAISSGGTDCDDTDSTVNPDAAEICGDGIDQDCDGSDTPCGGAGIEWCDVDLVDPDTIGVGDTAAAYGWVFSSGVTDSSGAGAGITGEAGYGPSGTDVSVDPGLFTWVSASYNADQGSNDEYIADLGPASSGTYAVAYRFSDDGGSSWSYCDAGGTDHATGDVYDTTSEWFLDVIGSIPVTDLVAGDLVITEFQANPAGIADSAGEWFEVFNASSDAVDLEGLVVSDLGTESFTVVGSLLLNAGTAIVFGNNGDSSTNDGATVSYEYGSAMNLANTADEIVLNNGSIDIDSVAWTSAWGVTSGYSHQLSLTAADATSNDDPANWCLSTSAYGTYNYGTPMGMNTTCP
jgi:hypothetical protein